MLQLLAALLQMLLVQYWLQPTAGAPACLEGILVTNAFGFGVVPWARDFELSAELGLRQGLAWHKRAKLETTAAKQT